MASESYDRETKLQHQLNAFLVSQLRLPKSDYYSRLDIDGFLKLKSVLSDINNILTLRVSLAFVDWVSKRLGLGEDAVQRVYSQVLMTKPNSNGFDIELTDPTKIVAEVKCNIPINGGTIYGSAQRDGITKDIRSLVDGKSKSPMKTDECLKFMVFLDKPEIRSATAQFIKNMKDHKESVVIVEKDTRIKLVEKVHVVFVTF